MDSVWLWSPDPSFSLLKRWASAAFQKFLQNINISKFLFEKNPQSY